MTGIITTAGYLQIKRPRGSIPCICPFNHNIYETMITDIRTRVIDPQYCGDWCPLFGEPEPHTVPYGLLPEKPGSTTYCMADLKKETSQTAIQLCHRTLVFDKFTDERMPA